jgi:hypothetical protein
MTWPQRSRLDAEDFDAITPGFRELDGVMWCLTHLGIVNEDESNCNRIHDDEDSCLVTPLFIEDHTS